MKPPVDLEDYRHKMYLELVLDMVEEAYQDTVHRRHTLVEAQLLDILETFDRTNNSATIAGEAQIVPFPEQ